MTKLFAGPSYRKKFVGTQTQARFTQGKRAIGVRVIGIFLKLLPLKRRFHDSQVVIITNFVVVSSVGIKRVVCKTVLNNILLGIIKVHIILMC